MELTFYGAAQTVTGSMHLVECNGYRILLDCGLYQGRRAEASERNRTLPFEANIQESDARFLRKHGKDAVQPLYWLDDVSRTMELFHTVPYRRRFIVFPGIEAAFYDAGHILGSAAIMIWLTETGRQRRVLFTGDVGRPSPAILRSPDRPPYADVVISESTYGGKIHEPQERSTQMLRRLIEHITNTQGKLLIPAFSVGRTQNLVYYLDQMHD
jgi:metallo-beta-lactamase family protein